MWATILTKLIAGAALERRGRGARGRPRDDTETEPDPLPAGPALGEGPEQRRWLRAL